MDIYYCDECGTRVTDLDLRAGRGMRKRHETICSGCVDQGLAGAWLARSGQVSAASAAKAEGGSASAAPAAVAVAEAPDPISLGRDRAQTQSEDPFGVDEPAPLKAKASTSPETDAIPAKPPSRQTPGDDLAAAGGGFGALVGSAMPSPSAELVDDPAESAEGAVAGAKGGEANDVPAGPLPPAPAESPFDFVHPKDNNNPGKSETEEIAAVGPKDETRAEERPARTASGRQVSQKRGATGTSKRTPAKAASTRRSGTARVPGNKVIVLSLISCAVMLIIFTLVMVNRQTGPKTGPTQITEEPYVRLKDATTTAKNACGLALNADDMPTILHAIVTGEEMMRAFNDFEKAARKRGWEEANFEEALRMISFNEVKSMLVQVRHRRGIVEQRNK